MRTRRFDRSLLGGALALVLSTATLSAGAAMPPASGTGAGQFGLLGQWSMTVQPGAGWGGAYQGDPWSSMVPETDPEPPDLPEPPEIEPELDPELPESPPPVTVPKPGGRGPLQQSVISEAKRLAGKRIAYAPKTNGGRKGCAQVASTILRRAGAIQRIRLSVRDVVKDLYGHGWQGVKPPPWKDGDVVTWRSYDRTGDGVTDPDTHIGIVLMQGGTPYVVDNSTSQRRVVKRELKALPYPVSRVMRKGDGDAAN